MKETVVLRCVLVINLCTLVLHSTNNALKKIQHFCRPLTVSIMRKYKHSKVQRRFHYHYVRFIHYHRIIAHTSFIIIITHTHLSSSLTHLIHLHVRDHITIASFHTYTYTLSLSPAFTHSSS